MEQGVGALCGLIRKLIPAVGLVVLLSGKPTAAADDGIPLSPYVNGLFGYIIGDRPSDHFDLPDQLVTKGTFRALDLGGQATVPIHSLRGIFDVSDSNPTIGAGGQKEIFANVAFGFTLNPAGQLSVFSDSAAVPLAEYGNGSGSATALVPRRVPVGPNLSGPLLRPAGTYDDFPPAYSKGSTVPRAAWVWGDNFTPTAVGVVTGDSAFRVAQAGDSVPNRSVPPPVGTGTTFTGFGSFTLSLNDSYVVFKGTGDLFNGIYTQRFSDGARFTVAESFVLETNFGAISGAFFHGDRDIFFGTDNGIFRGDAEGATPPEEILANDTEYQPGKIFHGGVLHHAFGDYAVIAGSGDNFLSTIFRLNLIDLSLEQIVQQGEAMPGGGTFGLVQRPGVSDQMVVFEGFDENTQFAGLFARMLDTWELKPIVRVGDTFDGREVSGTSYFPGAVDGSVVGFVVYFTDGSSGAYLMTMDYDVPVYFGNVSTRGFVSSGDSVLIGGFINALRGAKNNPAAPLGLGAKKVIIRAIGPSLGVFGVADPLADPKLELHLPDKTVITNDNWRATQEQEIIDSGFAPNDDLESAIVATLDPGSYTAIVSGSDGGTGVGLVEVYDLDGPAVSELSNISTRGLVQTGDKVMIAGIIVGGTEGTAATMVLRAIGPSLGALGVPNPLLDPTLELRDSDGMTIAENDNWKDTQQTDLEASGLAPGDDREAAIEIPLGPGQYTAIVQGAGGTSGVALVEAYNQH